MAMSLMKETSVHTIYLDMRDRSKVNKHKQQPFSAERSSAKY